MKTTSIISNQPNDGIQIMPHNDELEREVLGMLLVYEDAYEQTEQYLAPVSFYNTNHSIIFSAIQSLCAANKPHSMIDVVEKLRGDGDLDKVGGVVAISELASKVASSVYLVQHAMKLHEYEMRRGLSAMAIQIQQMITNPTHDVTDIIEFNEKSITDIQVNLHSNILNLYQSISNVYDFIRNAADNVNSAISTGLTDLDRILNGGFRSPDLIILGGRPSMGKTQFAVHFAEQAARQGKRVHFVSIEMTSTQLTMRMLAKGISYSNMRKGNLSATEYSKLDDTATEIVNLPITIADHPDCRYLSNIKSTARKLKRQGILDMLVIDYLQLIRTNQRFERRYIEVGYITGEMKALAKELNVPILLLAQLSRPAKGQEKELPKMEDLRESGDIEQDADIIIFPHRPSVYDENACDVAGRSWKNRGVLLVAKNREGERNVKAYFQHDSCFKQFFDDELNNTAYAQ